MDGNSGDLGWGEIRGSSEVPDRGHTQKEQMPGLGGGQGMSGHAAILMVSLRDPLHG